LKPYDIKNITMYMIYRLTIISLHTSMPQEIEAYHDNYNQSN